METIPVPFGPPTPAVSEAIDRFLDTCVRCECAGRDIQISSMRAEKELQNGNSKACLEFFPMHDLINYQIEKARWNTGSHAEGFPKAVVGDIDMMFTRYTWPDVVPNHPNNSSPNSDLLAIQSNRNNPAYITLEVPPSITFHQQFQQFIIQTQSGIRKLVSSELFIKNRPIPQGYTVQGPAFNTKGTRESFEHEQDCVPCFVCLSWPTCASGFLSRPRKTGWPSKNLIDSTEQLGCHVVGVGHPQSDNKDIEWRWSFSVAEKELIYDMSDVMYDCMYLLKAIKKHHWRCADPDKPTTFCSYYIKTACLWVCETEPHDVNVMELCRKVLAWLIFWYRTNTLPHYFIPNQNLIGHLSKDMCKEVYDWLLYIRSDLWYVVLSCEVMADHSKLIEKAFPGQVTSLRHLVKRLCVHNRTVNILELDLQNVANVKKVLVTKRYTMLFDLFDVGSDRVIEEMLAVVQPARKLCIELQLGEAVFIPMVQNMSTIVFCKGGQSQIQILTRMFTTVLYRSLGDYHLNKSVPAIGEEKELHIAKALKYYTLGKEMVHTDGWNDNGFGGDILLARLYYLNCQWDMLDRILSKFFDNLLSIRYCANFTPFVVLTYQNNQKCGHFKVWQTDREVYSVLKTNLEPDQVTYIHPVSLGYYMVCRYAHRQGDRAKVEWALGEFRSMSKNILSFSYCDNFTKHLISIIQRILMNVQST